MNYCARNLLQPLRFQQHVILPKCTLLTALLGARFDVRCHLRSYRYAAYGSNLHPIRLQKRVPSATLIGTSLLLGYSLRFHKQSSIDGSGKCNILVGESGVYVAVFEIAESERSELDKWEGLGYGYDGHEVRLDEFGVCSTYIAAPSAIDDSLSPIDWYKEYVLRGARFHGFPNEYVVRLERLTTVTDSDEDRAAREWKLVQEL